jgi:hypothetical protein
MGVHATHQQVHAMACSYRVHVLHTAIWKTTKRVTVPAVIHKGHRHPILDALSPTCVCAVWDLLAQCHNYQLGSWQSIDATVTAS